LMVSGGAVVVGVTGAEESRAKPGASRAPRTGTMIATHEMAAIAAIRIRRLRRLLSVMMPARYLGARGVREILRRC